MFEFREIFHVCPARNEPSLYSKAILIHAKSDKA